MQKVSILFSVLFVLILFACSRKSASQTSGTSKKEVAKLTLYETDVKQLIVTKCSPCHIPSAGGKKKPLDTYEAARPMADDIVRRIELAPGERGYMPFKNPQLTSEEIAVFRKWIKDGVK